MHFVAGCTHMRPLNPPPENLVRVRHGSGLALSTHLSFSCQLSTIRPAPFRPFRSSMIPLFASFYVVHHLCERNSSRTLFLCISALLRLSGLLYSRALCICGAVLLSFVCCFLCFRFEHHCCDLAHNGRSHCELSHSVLSLYTTPTLLA